MSVYDQPASGHTPLHGHTAPAHRGKVSTCLSRFWIGGGQAGAGGGGAGMREPSLESPRLMLEGAPRTRAVLRALLRLCRRRPAAQDRQAPPQAAQLEGQGRSHERSQERARDAQLGRVHRRGHRWARKDPEPVPARRGPQGRGDKEGEERRPWGDVCDAQAYSATPAERQGVTTALLEHSRDSRTESVARGKPTTTTL